MVSKSSSGFRWIVYWLICVLVPVLAGGLTLWGLMGVSPRLTLDLVWMMALGAVLVTAVVGAIVAHVARRFVEAV